MNAIKRQAPIGLLLAACALSFPAAALEFQWGEVEGSFNSQLSIGASWRISDQDPLLITPGNAPDFGTASTSTGDDGNSNYVDGDIYSLIIKGVHDLELRKGDFGLFVRGKYWYDKALSDDDLPHGNSANMYMSNVPLDDSGFDDFAQASGIELLDAFVYGTFYLGESGIPLDLRLGRQVASWGESTFIQNGINTINPVDVSAFRRPGAEIKEGLLPVAMFTASIGLTDALSFDMFYQLEWEKTVIDGCGTYFSSADVAATGCNIVTLTNALSDQVQMLPGVDLYIDRLPDIEPDDSGQWGASLRYFAERLAGSEFGLYYINYHSRIPYLGGFASSNPQVPIGLYPPALIDALTAGFGDPPWPFIPGNPFQGLQLGDVTVTGNPQYFAEFPEDIELFGVSFATNLAGFAVSGEVSHRPDFPVQINTTEILQGAVGYAPWSTALPRILEVGFGNPAAGYDRLPVTQAQVTFIRFFDQVLGASRLSFAAEIGGNWVGDLPQLIVLPNGQETEQRYGRSPIYGMGSFAYELPVPGQVITCSDGYAGLFAPDDSVIIPPVPTSSTNTNARNCTNDGYVTDSSWGYRVRASLTYNDVFAGINLTPRFAWSHDVDGYSPNSNFNEGAKALSLGLTAEYLNRYTASLDYTSFTGGDYNTIKDRDFVSLSLSVSF
ncbi:MAG: DUF1302 domain-containing protein [Gammaproteobacteria bacterium]|nr:DUF1302 domain-containing protein [Gammaproteobacteria bacterium]MBT8104771.1 DUF1302 domain-containing protein [Gammaproteobacteria bacterium]NNK24785.1 DUF1302 domain-containing protein [Woeseiaceae bacterium]